METVVIRINNINYQFMNTIHHYFFAQIKSVKVYFLMYSTFVTQFIKFCGVGILNTIVGYGSFFLLLNYTYYLLALLLAHIIGVTHSFIWNKFWIFRTQKFEIFEFIRFNVIYAIVFVANVIALYASVDIIHVNPRIAQLFLLPLITFISFFGQRLYTFSKIV